MALAALWFQLGRLNPFVAPVQMLGFSLIGAMFAALLVLLLAAPGWGRVRRGLSGRAPAVLGRYSYAIYMFHLPLCHAMRDVVRHAGMAPRLFGSTLAFQAAFTGVGFTISFVLAALSWRLLEQPILRLKDVFAPATSQHPAPASASAA